MESCVVEFDEAIIRRIAVKMILDICRDAMRSTKKTKELLRWIYDPKQRRSFCGACKVLRRDPQITADKIFRKLEKKFGKDIIREIIEELRIPVGK